MIEATIYNLLNISAITDEVSDRIFPIIAPQPTPNPCIVFNCDSVPEDDKDGSATLHIISVQVDIYTSRKKDYLTKHSALVDSVVAALDRFSGIDSGNDIQTIVLKRRDSGIPEPSGGFRTLTRFNVRLKT